MLVCGELATEHYQMAIDSMGIEQSEWQHTIEALRPFSQRCVELAITARLYNWYAVMMHVRFVHKVGMCQTRWGDELEMDLG